MDRIFIEVAQEKLGVDAATLNPISEATVDRLMSLLAQGQTVVIQTPYTETYPSGGTWRNDRGLVVTPDYFFYEGAASARDYWYSAGDASRVQQEIAATLRRPCEVYATLVAPRLERQEREWTGQYPVYPTKHVQAYWTVAH